MRAGEIRRPFWDSSTCSGPSARPRPITEVHAIARLQGPGDVDDQADPAAAMVDHQDPVIVAERAGEPNDPTAGAVSRAPRHVASVTPRERTPLR